MSQLIFNMNVVQTLSLSLKRDMTKLSANRMNVASIGNSVDSHIRARRNIGSEFSEVGYRLFAIESRLKNLDWFTQQAVTEYGQAENSLVTKSEEINSTSQLSILDQFLSLYTEFQSDHPKLNALRNAAILLGANMLDADKLLQAAKNLNFEMFKKNGNSYIRIINDGGLIDYKKYRNLLVEHLGGNAKKWDRNLIEKMLKEGLFLYGKKDSGSIDDLLDYTKRSEKLKDTSFKGMNDAIEQLKNSNLKNMGNAAWDITKGNLIVGDFAGWNNASNLTKAGKSFGIIGTVLTVGDNVISNFYDSEMGAWDFKNTENRKEFVVDLSVDVGSAATSMAAGAAVGSFFLPPVGTVVGVVAGATCNFAINYPILGDPKVSLVDYTKDKANEFVDSAGEFIGDTFDNMNKGLSKIFW